MISFIIYFKKIYKETSHDLFMFKENVGTNHFVFSSLTHGRSCPQAILRTDKFWRKDNECDWILYSVDHITKTSVVGRGINGTL